VRQANQVAEEAGLTPLEAMQHAVEALRQGKLGKALEKQRQGVQELRELAERLKKSGEALKGLAEMQQKLRAEAEKLAAEMAKSSDPKRAEALQESTDKLAAELMKLARSDEPSAEGRAATEAAKAVEQAAKAMQEAKEKRAQGEKEAARAAADEAVLKLELAGKQMAPRGMSDVPLPAATAKALEEGMRKAQQARDQLGTAPKLAASSMQQAANALQSAARQMSQGMRPNPNARIRLGSGASPTAPGASPLIRLPDSAGARSWGELPGELKNKLVQDLRARYGDDYADVIRSYFERLAAGAAKE
jgi:chromosome segregation ATPase